VGRIVSFFRAIARVLIALVAIGGASVAHAQDYEDNAGPVEASGDIRAIAVGGEPSWIDGGFGKARFGGRSTADDRTSALFRGVDASLAVKADISWALSATVVATAQDGQEQPVDLSEAFVSFAPSPLGKTRIAIKAGLFWPPVSLEHTGRDWHVAETITPSAINSWIGEEVKLGGVEANASWRLAKGRLGVTAAVFGLNDTAGTLLAFRGWGLGDFKATAFGTSPLPPLDSFMQYAQAPRTRQVIELDNRPGFYGRMAWNNTKGASVALLYYDNRGNPEAVRPSLQWGWRTRFTSLGATIKPATRLKLTAQGMIGSTKMGFPQPDLIWVDTDFRSAFVLATRSIGKGSVSLRGEAFGTTAMGSVLMADEGEHGWSTALAARVPVGKRLTVMIEGLHIDSERGSRQRVGLDARQRQTIGQLALRIHL